MTRYAFKLPDLGEGTVEAELIAWHVKVDDHVKEDQIIAEVMTEKAAIEVLSPVAGRVTGFTGVPGDILPVGGELIAFDISSGAPSESEAESVMESPTHQSVPTPASAPGPSALIAEANLQVRVIVGSISALSVNCATAQRLRRSPHEAARKRLEGPTW